MKNRFPFYALFCATACSVLLLITGLSTSSAQQMLGPGWQFTGPVPPLTLGGQPQGGSIAQSAVVMQPQSLVSEPLPTAITPQLQTLAGNLNDDPLKIFNYVRNNVEFQPYWGSNKGAHTTYLDGAGNDFDQCSLLIALLNAAGFKNTTYVYGQITVPDVSPTDNNDLAHWVGTPYGWLAIYTFYFGGVPHISGVSAGSYNLWTFDHIWVRAAINGTTYDLDPSYKSSNLYIGADFKTNSGYSRSDLLAAAGGTTTADYVQGASRSAVESKLASYATNLRNYFQTNYPNYENVLLLGGHLINQQTLTSLSQAAPLSQFSPTSSGTAPYVTFTSIPSTYEATFQVQVGTQINATFNIDGLQGNRISLTFSGGNAQLWQGDTLVASENNGSGTTANVTLTIIQPGDVSTGGSLHLNQTLSAVTYLRTGSYDLSYAVYPNPKSNGQIDASNQQLQTYLAGGLKDTSRQVMTETLHGLGLRWARRVALEENLLSNIVSQGYQLNHIIGRTGQESSYYVDMPGVASANFDVNGNFLADQFNAATFLLSAMEHGVIEQSGCSPGSNASLSTVKALILANDGNQKIFKATSANYAAGSNVSSQLTNYSPTLTNTFSAEISAGHTLLLHQNGSIILNHWVGSGYADFNTGFAGMVIGGLYNGGYNSNVVQIQGDYATVTVNASSTPQSTINYGNPDPVSVEPVDLLTGAYTMEHADLTVGLAGTPLGLNFTRYYDSTRMFQSSSLGNGWRHSCEGNVTLSSELDAAFGFRLATDAAQTIVGIIAVNDFSDVSYSPQELLVGALAANWTVNRVTNNCANVQIGNQLATYTSLPDGSWNPPPGSTTTLTGGNGIAGFVLSPRFGGSITFDSSNRIGAWIDVDGNRQNYFYNVSPVSEGRLTQVTDSFGRSLTFTYGTSGAANGLLTGVSDGNGRSVGFSYTAGTQASNLTGITDPVSNTTTLVYDSRNRLTDWKDPNGATVTHNVYDGQDRVLQQLSQNNATHTWNFRYSPGQTVEIDPLGNVTTHLFDFKSREWATIDALGNEPFVVYDGQNHVNQSTDATSRTSYFLYDGNENLYQAIDPAGKTANYQYDASLRLWKETDPTNRTVTHLYDAKNHPSSVTDAGGRTTTFTYYANGLLNTITDNAGKVTTINSYSNGLPVNVTRADGTTTSSTYYAWGDLLSYTDGNSQTTHYTFDNRRLPATRTDPYGHITTTNFDVNGYPSSVTDRNNHTTTTVYNNLGHLVSTTAPDTGTVTSDYNNADWLTSVTDILNHSTSYGYDLDGRRTSVTNALNITTSTLGLDGAGRVGSNTDGLNHTTQFFYDAAGRLYETLDPSNHSTIKGFDDSGRVLTLQNKLGKTFGFGYANDGLASSFTYPSARQSQIISWDADGRPQTTQSPSGQQTILGYDGMGRVQTHSDGAGAITWGYDGEGNPKDVTEVIGTNSTDIHRVFDDVNRVTSCTDTLGYTVGYGYDNEGNVTSITYPGNKTVQYTYDGSNRLKTVTDWAGRLTTYYYDTAGRLQSVSRPNGTQQGVTLDNANRLQSTSETQPGGGTLWQAGYQFDHANRLVTYNPTPIAHNFAPPAATMTYDADNQLSTYNGQNVSHDLDGNLLSAPVQGTLLGTLTWDARNRLTSAGGITYTYDAENRRMTSTIGGQTTQYIWSRGGKLDHLLARVNPDGSVTRYIYGKGLLYEETTNASGTAQNPIFYHFDWRGDTMALSDINGNVLARLSYSPYGEMTIESGTVNTPFCFNGEWGVLTEPNGLLAMQARFYSPILRRFLNEDPSGFAGGANLYAFTGGDPIDAMDPFGLGPITTGGNDSSSLLAELNRDAQHAVGLAIALTGGAEITHPPETPLQHWFVDAINSVTPQELGLMVVLSPKNAGEELGMLSTTRTASSITSALAAETGLSDTVLLQQHLDNAIARFNSEGYTAEQAASIAENPGLAAAHKGTQIDTFFKESVSQDPALRHLELTPRFQFGPDVFDPETQRWWDVTTPKQWDAHVQKYWLFGEGTSLFH